jgi:REP element-mobilizing transposase RayT
MGLSDRIDFHISGKDSMARPLRIQYPGAWYHVTCRGNERRDIFADDSDRCQFLDILTESIAIYGVEIHGYVLMTNHFHFVVHTPQANLNRFMQRFNTTYTVYFNRRHHHSGHLFQGRYKALLVDADSYLLELSRYVHLNPVRVKGNAALSPTEKRETLRSYRWSSFSGYTQLGKRPEFLHCGKILTMIGTGDDPHSRRAYRHFVQKGLDAAPEFNLKEKVRAQTVLCTDDFLEWLRDRFLAGKKGKVAELPAARSLSIRPKSIEDVAAQLAAVLNVDPQSLLRPRSPHRDERSILLELCRQHLAQCLPMSAVSAALGVGVSALSQNRRRLQERIEKDPALRLRFELAVEALGHSE